MASILVIDDDELVGAAIGAVLRRAGHRVVLAQDGADGFAAFNAHGFDLVLTDIVMPRMEGLETVRALRAADGAIGIIAMSGCARDGAAVYLAAAVAFGADATLVKPFTPAELRCAVAAVLAICDDRAEKPDTRRVS